MSAVNMWTLLLLAAAVGAGADDCHSLNATLAHKDLDQIFGDWVLVWAVADHGRGQALFGHVISSHVELRLLADNHTVSFSQRTRISGNKCTNYFNNMSLPAEDSEDQTLHIQSARIEAEGKLLDYNETGGMRILQSCNESLSLVYGNTHGQHLMIYRRDGRHQDVENLQNLQAEHQNRAECLGFPHHKPFVYDGAAGLCHEADDHVKS